MSKPVRVRLTYTLQADLNDGRLENAQSLIRFSAPAREQAVGDRLVRLAIWSLQRYQTDRWEDWQDVNLDEE